jgi:hypothetical protein
MYNVKIRDLEIWEDVRTDGQGIAAGARRTRVRRFGSLVEAEELAKGLASEHRLG